MDRNGQVRRDAVDVSQQLIRKMAAALFVLVLMVAVVGIGTWQDYKGGKQHDQILQRICETSNE